MTRVRNRPGVRRLTLRSKIRLTWLGRPISRFSRITSSKKMRPVTGLSSTWVSENSACRIVAIARSAVAGRERMRQSTQPLAQQPVDSLRAQAVAQLLQQFGLRAGLDAVVQRLERHPALGQLALQVLVAVDAQLGVVGKVGAELQEERSKLLVHAVEIVVVDHRGGFDDPRIGRSGPRAAAALRAHHPRLLLRLAHVQNAFAFAELAQVRLREVVLALALLEGNEVDAFGSDKALDVADERLGHRRYRRGGGKPLAPVHPQVPHPRSIASYSSTT